jgi:hypothetical protein
MLVAVLAAALAGAAPAAAAGPGNAALAKQVRALGKQVTVLQTRVSALNGALTESQATVAQLKADSAKQEQDISFVDDKDTCTTAITWDGLNLIVQYLTGSLPNRLDDKGACARVGIARSSPAPLAHGGFLGGLSRLAGLLSR